jgi:hypothetical protein
METRLEEVNRSEEGSWEGRYQMEKRGKNDRGMIFEELMFVG